MVGDVRILEAEIRKGFGASFLLDACFQVETQAGGVAVVFGPSGAGKTVLLRCLAGLERPSSGRIVFNGATWYDGDSGLFRPAQARRIGYVPQECALFPHLTVRANVEYGLSRRDRREKSGWVDHLLNMLRIWDLQSEGAAVVSGGERQRTALARALARRPDLLLLDEPLSALDVPTRKALRIELRRCLRELDVPAFLVSHDWEDALALGDDMIVMSSGRVLQSGHPLTVLGQPGSIEVASIVGVETVTAGHITERLDGVVKVGVRGQTLWVAGDSPAVDEVYVCLRSENLSLEIGSGTKSSARNHLRGRVLEIAPAGPLLTVSVDVGFRVSALVTRQAIADLGVSVGDEVAVGVKATAVHLIPRG